MSGTDATMSIRSDGALPPAHVARAPRVPRRVPVVHADVLADDKARRDDVVTGIVGRHTPVGTRQRECATRPLLELVHRDQSELDHPRGDPGDPVFVVRRVEVMHGAMRSIE